MFPRIDRQNPTCLIFLVDQSGSMVEPFGGAGEEPGLTKAQHAARSINRQIHNLVLKCAKREGIREYLFLGLIGYGRAAGSAWGGALAGQELVSIRDVALQPLRMELRERTVTGPDGQPVVTQSRMPVWIDPQSSGRTPMCAALEQARDLLQRFLADHPGVFPPLVLNLTDGLATDGDPEPIAQAVRRRSVNGEDRVLLFNAHVSTHGNPPIEFPDEQVELPGDYARLLFRMSSPLPAAIRDLARPTGPPLSATARGFVYNANAVAVERFLDLGTRVTTQRAGSAGSA